MGRMQTIIDDPKTPPSVAVTAIDKVVGYAGYDPTRKGADGKDNQNNIQINIDLS